MKVLKPLVHTIYSDFNRLSGSTCKKTHLYELIASYFGYKSYASMQSKGVMCFFPANFDEESAKARSFDRALSLKYSPSDAVLIIKLLEVTIEASDFDTPILDNFCHYLDAVNWVDPFEDETVDNERTANEINDLLQVMVARGNTSARFAQLIWSCCNLLSIDENPDYRSARYWHQKRSSGGALSDHQNEVADMHLKIEGFNNVIEEMIRATHQLGETNTQIFPRPEIIKPIVQALGEDQGKQWTSVLNGSPFYVLDVLNYLVDKGRIERSQQLNRTNKDWLIAEFLAEPTRDSLFELFDASSKDTEKWFWYLFGLEYNIDVSKDDHYAINLDTGDRDYDDGAASLGVGGYTGIELPHLTDKSKSTIRSKVRQLVSQNN